jgi:outer membrane receptor protein involved in Fe transport
MRKLLILMILLATSVITAVAQSQSTSGNIEGRVVDPNGAVVPGIAVSATNQNTGFGKTTISDSDGNYIFVLLPPGSYKVEVGAAKGFAAATYNNVQVTVGAKTALEISLTAGTSVTVVDVSAEGQGVETTRTSISSTVDERRVTNLPTNGRNFLDFATLAPGVIRDPTRAGDLAVGGQKGTLNSIQIDGASSDNTFFGQSTGRIGSGRAASQFSIDTVKEFQVNQNGFSAEYGRAAGAVINVVTKSGTNNFTGSAFEYFRDESLNARNPNLVAANRARPPGQINQFGGTLGGPFKHDKAFFFAAYEGQRSDLPNPVILNSLPFAPASVITLLTPKVQSYDISRQQDTLMIKTDFNINEKNQLWVRFNYQNFRGTNLENSGPLSALEHTGNSNVKTATLTSAWTSTLSANWFNEFRFQYSKDKEPGLANSNSPEATVTANAGGFNDGTFNFGRNNFSPRETTITRYQFINNQTYLSGNHAIKYGVDLLFDQIFNFFPGLFGGSYTFASYATLASLTPSRYRQSFGGAGTTGGTTEPNNREYGFFIQDDWRIDPKATINFGVRYDYQSIAQPPVRNPNAALIAAGFDTSFRPSDKNNFAPRFGLSYAFNEKTVIRGGFGLYYGRTPAIMTGTAHSQNGIQVIAIDINCTTAPAGTCPTYPNVFASVPTNVAAVTPNLYLFSQSYEQPYTLQTRLQFEREIWKNMTFSMQYTMFRGDDLSRTRNANLGAPVPTTLFVYTGTTATATATTTSFTFLRHPVARPIPAFQRISLFESTARSQYHGLTFELNRRLADRWQFNMSYTLSNAKDDKPDQTSVVPGGGDDAKIAENQFDLSGEYGRADADVRHRFIFSPVYETGTFKHSENKVVKALLSDYVFTGIFVAQSGIAYSALVSGDPNADGITSTDKVPGTKRNEFSTPSAYIFDMRVGRVIRFSERYRLSLFVEGFNIFNRPNVSAVNNTQYAVLAATAGPPALPLRLGPQAANFRTPRLFISGSPSFTFNSSYNRELQLGIRFDF